MVHVFHSLVLTILPISPSKDTGQQDSHPGRVFLSHTGRGALSLSSATKLEESVFSAGV